ncbi:MAG: hypothetical protein AYL28_004870 [Candidatus Bathyarchaeota archaeon B23]|nr:MAG: hypothetical protein AYL28_004870 [Candidatus Bathyarchaeota archaeon B23]
MSALSQEFREIYSRSGLSTPYEDYMRRTALLSTLTYALSVVLLLILHTWLLPLRGLKLLMAIFIPSATIGLLTLLLSLYYPLYKRNQRRTQIDDSLLYALSYMAALSAGGLPIERIMERISEVEESEALRLIAGKFIADVRVFGFDVPTALRDVARRSPSELMEKLLEGVRNVVQTSGDLRGLLTYEVRRMLGRKREKLKRMMSTLVYLGELYVSLLVVAPILFILILTVLSVIGGNPLGIPPQIQLNLLVFVGIPTMAAGFTIVLDAIMGGEE